MSPDTNFVDYYELLGLSPSAAVAEIRRAYIIQAKNHHPDAGGSTEIMKRLNAAYKTLTDSTSKASYDMLHSFHVGTTQPSDYKYADGRKVGSVDDMNDDEIDNFLDTLIEEYRDGVTQTKSRLPHWLARYFNKG